jgi:hypothetical protein
MAVTPAVAPKGGWLLEYEEKSAQAGGQLKGRLFASTGENENPGFLSPVRREILAE